MSAPALSEGLAALIADMKPHELAGRILSPREVRLLVGVLEMQAAQARMLEAEARELAQLRAMGGDLSTVAHSASGGPSLKSMRAAVARVATLVDDETVVLFPIVPRPRPRPLDERGEGA